MSLYMVLGFWRRREFLIREIIHNIMKKLITKQRVNRSREVREVRGEYYHYSTPRARPAPKTIIDPHRWIDHRETLTNDY